MRVDMLDVGTKAPDLKGTDQGGQVVDLDDLLQRGPVVLYFYPKDFTPVCTREACHFRDIYDDLQGRGATIVGVSIDDQATHEQFARKHGIQFSLVADPSGTVAEAYRVKGRFLPTTKRVTYVIDQGRTIRGVFHYELRAMKHVDEVLRCLDALGA